MKDVKERIAFLGLLYPCLCIHVMQEKLMHKEQIRYMNECRLLEDDYQMYSFYVHGWLLPWLNQKR